MHVLKYLATDPPQTPTAAAFVDPATFDRLLVREVVRSHTLLGAYLLTHGIVGLQSDATQVSVEDPLVAGWLPRCNCLESYGFCLSATQSSHIGYHQHGIRDIEEVDERTSWSYGAIYRSLPREIKGEAADLIAGSTSTCTCQ